MPWHLTSQQEFAFMANASADQPNVWDRLLGGGDWLRLAELRVAGAEAFATRAKASRGEVEEAYWQEVVAAASCFGADVASSIVTMHGTAERRVHVLTAQRGELLSQLLISQDTMALRWGPASEGWPSIEAELRDIDGCTALRALAWDEVRGERLVAWESGTFARSDGEGVERSDISDSKQALTLVGHFLTA